MVAKIESNRRIHKEIQKLLLIASKINKQTHRLGSKDCRKHTQQNQVSPSTDLSQFTGLYRAHEV
jgi:hypothetical protein